MVECRARPAAIARRHGPRKGRFAGAFLCVAAALACGGAQAVAADWAPVLVEVRDPPFNPYGTYRRVDYVPGTGANEPWQLCASLPGLEFAYFRAVAHGLREEAARQNVRLRIEDAGGFDGPRQRRQLQDCMDEGADALLVAAAADGALAPLIDTARASGVPVIDMVTGTDLSGVSARVVADARTIGFAVGHYVADRHPIGSAEVRAAWFPGPRDADFSAAYDAGFRQAAMRGAVEIAAGGFVALERDALSEAVRAVVSEGSEIAVIAGVGPAIAIAAQEIGEMSRPPALVATGVSTEVVAGIAAGHIEAAINDKPVIVARIAVDLAIRVLDGEPYIADLRPTLEVVDQSNIEAFDRASALAPDR